MRFHCHHPGEVPGAASSEDLAAAERRLMALIRATQDRVGELEDKVSEREPYPAQTFRSAPTSVMGPGATKPVPYSPPAAGGLP